MRKHALGIVVKDRFGLTQKTLQSLYHSDQAKDSYDLYIIDNGSNEETKQDLRQWVESAIIPVKNLIHTKNLKIGAVWNLFLALTKNYPFRTKLDNDLIFANTPVADKPYQRTVKSRSPNPGEAGVNPGAVPVAGFTIGAGKKINSQSSTSHTCFLQHLEDGLSNSNLGICSLAPVKVGETLANAIPKLGKILWLGQPCLAGACMTITKKTFDKLGYFDERLSCHIDWEYSQRAMAAGINVGYASNYCVIHLGEHTSTITDAEKQNREFDSKSICEQSPLPAGFAKSKWEAVQDKIINSSQKNLILNLS